MTILQQVHYKMQELCQDNNRIPIDTVLLEFGDNNALIKSQIKLLKDLKFIEFANCKEDIIKLTFMGKFSHLPANDGCNRKTVCEFACK